MSRNTVDMSESAISSDDECSCFFQQTLHNTLVFLHGGGVHVRVLNPIHGNRPLRFKTLRISQVRNEHAVINHTRQLRVTGPKRTHVDVLRETGKEKRDLEGVEEGQATVKCDIQCD